MSGKQKEVIEEVSLITPGDTFLLKQTMAKMSLKGLKGKRIMTITRTSRVLSDILEEFNESKKALADAWGLKPETDGSVQWHDHPEKEKINTAFTEINSTKFDFDKAIRNFLTEEEFEMIVENSILSTEEIIFLQDYLMEEEEIKPDEDKS